MITTKLLRRFLFSGSLALKCALVCLCPLAVSPVAVAQTNYFFQPAPSAPEASRLWQEPTNWLNPAAGDMFVPNAEFNEAAVVDNGATAVLTVSSPDSGEESVVTPGEVSINNGGLDIRSTGALHSKIFTGTNGTSTGNFNLGSTNPGTLSIQAGGSLLVDGDATFSNNASYQVQVTGASSAGSLSTLGVARLAGALELNFDGYTPNPGNSWTILDASTIIGSFDSVVSNGSLASNQAIVVGQVDLGGGRLGVNASVEELLMVEVNRDTGQVRITQPGSSNIAFDGYFVGSDGGLLSDDPADWTSLTESGQYGNDWVETAQTTHNVGELKIGADATFSGEVNLGNIYNPFGGNFGESVEDLEFGFRRSSDGAEFNGLVHFTGTTANSLVLQVDPSGTGDAFLRNTSHTTVQIDGYEVLSSEGALSTSGWNSLDEQDSQANAWLEALDVGPNLLAEFDSEGFTTIAPGASLNLGPLFTGGAQDLQFNFLMMGQEEGTTGVVVYEPFAGTTSGDFDGDGDVDGADFLAWQRGESPNPLSAADLAAWQTNYGATASTVAVNAVPEPQTMLLLVLSLLGWGCRRTCEP